MTHLAPTTAPPRRQLPLTGVAPNSGEDRSYPSLPLYPLLPRPHCSRI
uniref:Uncharacterized protein n=1 Tax=Setaria italica TaxID=4555 RepID=K4ANE6_SETIT